MTLDNRDGKELILCESDDLVFEFDCNATSECGVRCEPDDLVFVFDLMQQVGVGCAVGPF